MGIEIIGIEEEMAKVVEEVKNGTLTKVKVMGIEDGDVDGINIHNSHLKVMPQGPTIRTRIITDHHPWDIKVNISNHLHNTHPTIPHNSTQTHNRNPNLPRLQTYVNCVIIKDTMITNVNLQGLSKQNPEGFQPRALI